MKTLADNVNGVAALMKHITVRTVLITVSEGINATFSVRISAYIFRILLVFAGR